VQAMLVLYRRGTGVESNVSLCGCEVGGKLHSWKSRWARAPVPDSGRHPILASTL